MTSPAGTLALRDGPVLDGGAGVDDPAALFSGSGARLELAPGSRVQPPGVAVWEGGGDRERYDLYTREIPPLRFLSLADVRLFGYGQLADAGGQVFHHSEFCADEVLEIGAPMNLRTGAYSWDSASAQVVLSAGLAQRHVADPCVLLSQCGINTYGHWLLDILPKIVLARRLPRPVRFIKPLGLSRQLPAILDWQREFFALLDVAPEEIITYDPCSELLRLDRAIAVTQPRLYYGINPLANEAFDAVRHRVCGEPAAGDLKLYLSRRGMRREQNVLVNREEVETLVASRGFTVLEPEGLPVREQVALFSRAHTVVGEQGSALHNTAFSPRGTRVLCLHPPDAQLFAQAGIARIRAQPTGFIFGTGRDAGAGAGGQAGYGIDAALLARGLDRMEQL